MAPIKKASGGFSRIRNTAASRARAIPKAKKSPAEKNKEVYVEEDSSKRLDLEDNEPEYNLEEVVEGEGDEKNTEEEQLDDGAEEELHEVECHKRKDFEVFVSGLDKDATDDDLWEVFSEVGEVTTVELMSNIHTSKNVGYAFVRFATMEQAKRAVSELKNPVVNGKQCDVYLNQDNDTLFLGKICKTWTKEDLKESLKQYGVENFEDLTLVENINNEGMTCGIAFLEFATLSNAIVAYKRLQKRDVSFGVGWYVAFAKSFIEPDMDIMTPTVFVKGLPAAWDEDCVKEYLKKFGEIVKVELVRNMQSAKRKDFGFVTFDTYDSAVACVYGINNAGLGEGDKVKVRAILSQTHQRERAESLVSEEISGLAQELHREEKGSCDGAVN